MVSPAPNRFNPELLVRSSERLSVSFPLSQCKRLVALLADESGEFSAEFELKRVGRQLIVSGRFESAFVLECQRCLHDYTHSVASDFEFVLVATEEAAEETDEATDPVVLAEDGSIHVIDLFEDELILQVPPVPKHATPEQCDFDEALVVIENSDSGKQQLEYARNRNAFAALKNITFDND